jgi:hypothetical protein
MKFKFLGSSLAAGLSSRESEFEPRPANVRKVVKKYRHWERFLSRVLRFSPVSIIPRMLHIHVLLNASVIRRTSGRRLGNFKESYTFENRGVLDRKYSRFVAFFTQPQLGALNCCNITDVVLFETGEFNSEFMVVKVAKAEAHCP